MRLFIGIDIPDDLKEKIAGTAGSFSAKYEGKYADFDSYHITLAYIGECDVDMRDMAIEAMRSCADGFEAVEVDIDGAGYFGKQEKAILHLEADTAGNLQGISDSLRAELDERGLPYDAKPLIPHITLGRKVALSDDFTDVPVECETFRAEGLTLFHSCRVDDVLKYIPIHFERFSEKGGKGL